MAQAQIQTNPNDVLNPDGSIWQFFIVQNLMREGTLDGDPLNPDDIARHLTGIGETPLTRNDVLELGRQAQQYDAQYRS
jgi:hypothetical protein